MSAERRAAHIRFGATALRGPMARKSERRDRVRCEVHIDIDVQSGETCQAGVTRDLSEAGAFIATELELDAGSVVELRVHLPGHEPIRCLGEVRWRRATAQSDAPVGVGLRFVLLDADALRALQAFLLARAPLDAGD